MAVLTNSTTFATSFVVTRDIEDIAGQIKQTASRSLATGPLAIWFVGEAHNNDFDVRRRREVFALLANDNKIVLAVERTLVASDAASNVVVENNDLKSFDDGRNRQIVGMVQDKLGELQARTVVFFYGQEHEHPVCQHLLRDLPATDSLQWTTCLPIEMSLKDRLSHEPSLFPTVGRRPIGYCENNGRDYLLKLLEKGWVHDHFNIDLYAADQVGSLFSRTIYAVYYKDQTYTDHQRKLVESDGTAAIAIRRINGAYTTVAKIIRREDVPAAEARTLDV